jgi:Cytochrome C oxidase, cbb3-type, subunit III
MNWIVLLAIAAALLTLRQLKVSMLVWLLGWWLAVAAVVRFGFETPVPASVQKIYLSIVSAALVAYVFSDRNRLEEVRRPLFAFATERRYAPLLALVCLAIPTAVAANIYMDMTAPARAPVFGRTVHPAPPSEINVHDQEHNMITLDNPYRSLEQSDPAAFQARVAEGRQVYYQNCFFCHGDVLAGDGMFIHGLNPIPSNFQDQGTLPILQESFVFWRIAKGAPGLPDEAGPWDSAMPAWEKFLSEDEIWNVILFLYDFTGVRPRARHETGEH